jgi:hypothetical protein
VWFHVKDRDIFSAGKPPSLCRAVHDKIDSAPVNHRGTRMTPEERDYLRMRYEEDAEHARLHETVRAGATGLVMALVAGLLAFAVEQKDEMSGKQWVAGLLICGASLLGAVFNQVYEKAEAACDKVDRLLPSAGSGGFIFDYEAGSPPL